MTNFHSPLNFTSADLEKAALKRFRSLASILPLECKVSRSMWGRSTIVCLDFADCADLLDSTREQSLGLLKTAHELGLAKSLLFRKGKKVIGWKTF